MGAMATRESDVIHPVTGPRTTPIPIRSRTLGIFVTLKRMWARKLIRITPPMNANATATVIEFPQDGARITWFPPGPELQLLFCIPIVHVTL